MISGSIPGISSWNKAKQSELDLRKLISLCLSPAASLDRILRFRVESPSTSGTSSISSTSGSSACRVGVAIEPRLSNDHVYPATVVLVPFIVLPPSAFMAWLIFSRLVLWSRIIISTWLVVEVQEEVLYAGHRGEFASEEYGGQSRAEKFAVRGRMASRLVELT